MIASVVSHDLSIKTTGTIYKAVYTFNTGQPEDNRSLHNLQQCFHKCSMTSKCNYVVLDKLNSFKMYNTRDEIPAEEELLGIWMQTSSKLSGLNQLLCLLFASQLGNLSTTAIKLFNMNQKDLKRTKEKDLVTDMCKMGQDLTCMSKKLEKILACKNEELLNSFQSLTCCLKNYKQRWLFFCKFSAK